MGMKSVVSEKGQVTIPKIVRDRLGLRPGTVLSFEAVGGQLIGRKEDGDVLKFLVGKGMRSALALYAPDRPTWRWNTVVGTLHRQLDHVRYGERLEVLSAEVRDAGRSDHLPVIAVIAASGQGGATQR